MRSIAKVLGKTLTSVQVKASRLGLVVVDGSEKNTPSTTTFDKLVLPIESCRRRSSAQLCVWDGATLALKKNIEWTWASNINGASYVSSVAVEDGDDDGKNEISSGGYNDGTRNVAQLCVWNGATLVLKNVETWYWTSSTEIRSVAVGNVDGDAATAIVTGGNYYDGTRGVAQLCVWS